MASILKRRRKWRRRDYIAPGFALVAIALVAATYWKRAHNQVELDSNPQVVKEQLQKLIPTGMRLTQAAGVMKQHGFDCMTLKHSVFGNAGPFDYLYCDRAEATDISHWWQVALVEREGSVAEVLVNSGTKAP